MKNRQNIFLLIEPPIDPWSFPSKIGYSYMNRFTIDDDAAFELIGVGYLSETIVQKRNYGTNGIWRMKDFDYDNRIIDDAIEKASIHEGDIHLMIAADLSFDSNGYGHLRLEEDPFVPSLVMEEYLNGKIGEIGAKEVKPTVLGFTQTDFQAEINRSMKKYNMKKILVTMLKLYRENLITKEKVERYCTEEFFSRVPFIATEKDLIESKQHLNESVFDDLESTFQHLKSGNEKEACSKNLLPVTSYFIPKLTQKELNLVDMKDELYLKTFWNFRRRLNSLSVDVDEAEMKRSESKSKFVNGVAKEGFQIDSG